MNTWQTIDKKPKNISNKTIQYFQSWEDEHMNGVWQRLNKINSFSIYIDTCTTWINTTKTLMEK